MTLTPKELMVLAALRIEELLEDLSAATGLDSYDHGTSNLIKDLRRSAR